MTKTDLSPVPLDKSGIQSVTPSQIYQWEGLGPDVVLTGTSEERMPSEQKWYALTGRVVDVKVEADGDIHLARLLKIIHKLRNFCVVKAKRRLPSEHGPALRLNRRKEALWMRILIVEDEVGLAHYISRALLEAGHDPVLVHDGETAIGEVQEKRCQLIILDVMLPGIDGFEVLRRLRAARVDSRVLILSARGEVTDRVTGLALGADDYLAKPFAMRELVARVTALGRRFPQKAPVKLQVADLVLTVIDEELYRANRRIELSARERTLLRVLMREPGRVFSRTELCERVWERAHEYDTKLVECFISRLRKKIDSPPLIHTVRHLGYTIRKPESETGHYRGTSRFARRGLL